MRLIREERLIAGVNYVRALLPRSGRPLLVGDKAGGATMQDAETPAEYAVPISSASPAQQW